MQTRLGAWSTSLVCCLLAIYLGQFHQHAAATGLHAGQLAVPAIDQRFLVLDLSELEKLRRQRILADAVGFGFTLRACDRGFGVAFCCGDLLGGLGLRLRKLVAGALSVLNRLGLRRDRRKPRRTLFPPAFAQA